MLYMFSPNILTSAFYSVWLRDLVCHPEGRKESRVFKNKVLRSIFESEKEKLQVMGENCISNTFIIFPVHHILWGVIESRTLR